MKTALLLVLLSLSFSTWAQHDSLILKNGNIIVGEVKSMDKGVLTIETPYSKSDFTISWSGIKEIFCKSRFLVTLTDGRRINGVLQSSPGTSKVSIVDQDNNKTESDLAAVVYLKGIKSDFWSRANASIDLGLSFTKANNLRQYQVRSNIGYLADKWQLSLFYNDLRSKQDSVAETERTEWGPSFRYFLQRDWYLGTSLNFLSNTEQALKLRTTGKLGAGRYFVHTNKSYLSAEGGFCFNNESFTNGTASRSSWEAYVGSEVNLFDVKDLSLLSSVYVYPSITESGRWRVDFSLDMKYELPLNLYLRLGGTLNYDNRPAVKGKETDYVVSFSVGWSL